MTAKDTPTPRPTVDELYRLHESEVGFGTPAYSEMYCRALDLERELAASAGGAPDGVWSVLSDAVKHEECLCIDPDRYREVAKRNPADLPKCWHCRARAALALRGREVAKQDVDGWRLLNAGEAIEPGDELFSNGCWQIATAEVGELVEKNDVPIRTRIYAAPVAPAPWRGSEYDKAVEALAPYLPDGWVAQDEDGSTDWYEIRPDPEFNAEMWCVAIRGDEHASLNLPKYEGEYRTSLRRIESGRVVAPSPALNEGGE